MSKNTDHSDYYGKASTWDQDIMAGALRSRKRAWILAGSAMGLALISQLSLLALLPLKSFAPFVVTVEKSTGFLEVSSSLESSLLSEDEAVTQANLVQYLTLREQYNPAVLEQNYERVMLMSDDRALKDYQSLWSAQNPENPSIVLGKKAAIDVQIKSVALLNENTASVRFIKQQFEHERKAVSHWNAIIQFRYSQKPMRMAQRFQNPLGFKVTSYRVNPETVEISQ